MNTNNKIIWDFYGMKDIKHSDDGVEIISPFKLEVYENRIVIEIAKSEFVPRNHPAIMGIRTSVQTITIYTRTLQQKIRSHYKIKKFRGKKYKKWH